MAVNPNSIRPLQPTGSESQVLSAETFLLRLTPAVQQRASRRALDFVVVYSARIDRKSVGRSIQQNGSPYRLGYLDCRTMEQRECRMVSSIPLSRLFGEG